MRVLFCFALIGLFSAGASAVNGATHNISSGFDFGGGGTVNPRNGWTFADGAGNPLTTFTQDWNAPDFAPGQPGWEGASGQPHAGWAKITEDNALASGFDVVEGEIATHGTTNAIYTPNVTLGDPYTGHHSVSITGTMHNLRGLGRSGPWFLLRNDTDLLALGTVDDTTLSFENGPLNFAQNATFIDTSQVTVSGNQLTGISYNPGDFFNVRVGNNDFVAVDVTIDSFAAPGNGFGVPVIRPQVAYYRFEETSGVDVRDVVSGDVHGVFSGAPAGLERSTDVPTALIPQTGAANTRAADFRQGGAVLFNASEFVFNEASAGGADGDATLEWFMKVPNDGSPDIIGPNGHTSIFWTNGIGGFDGERFNIFWDASFTGAEDSDRFVSGDYRSIGSGGAAIPIDVAGHNNGNPLTEDEWHHLAIVRTDNTPGNAADFDFTWDWYIDGTLSSTQHAVTSAPTPSEDNFGWTIAGRPGFPFRALIDEVRMTAAALSPDEFLNAAATVTDGDFDGDDDVDGRDLLIWQRGGSPIPHSISDLNKWKNNFGTTGAHPASGVGAGASRHGAHRHRRSWILLFATPAEFDVREPSGDLLVRSQGCGAISSRLVERVEHLRVLTTKGTALMKNVIPALLLLAGALFAQPAHSAPGDIWSLSGDFQIVSNPSPPVDPGLAGGGTGTWTYIHGGGNFANSTTNLTVDVNSEVPNDGVGWFNPGANHVMLAKFSIDANPVPPLGTGDDKTNFQAGDIGGHATIGTSWSTDHSGTFLIEWLGYNARNQQTANPNETGRVTTLRMTGPGGDLDVVSIAGGAGYDGSANAYTNSTTLSLAAGDVLVLKQEGGEWCGMDLRITEVVPEPARLAALFAAGVSVLVMRRMRRQEAGFRRV